MPTQLFHRNRPARLRHGLSLIGAGLATLAVATLVIVGWPVSPVAQAAPPPGAVFSGYKDQMHLITGANQQVVVGRLSLPAGSYTISAKFYTTNSSNFQTATLRCILTSQQGDYDETWFSHDASVAFASASLNVVHTYPGSGSVLLTCGHVWSAGDTYLRFVKITAVATGNLVNRPLP